ncbi:DUF2489 domain-containing protein [Billgrantia desiderata]|uniref:DUF2489 domain-containing protein n=1 Tax=Billgrantia desiderata TaxID=52021 RepID=A0AAW4YQT4_9GAMM|nr:DUF2489 domain-containing protein [Halomonas desiderata]MCE8014022.1 DUF2489 domain-containing protein [Halomonas desiderata]MCE8027136.1 DUF2489 domain-containing protein [Halomonas desiderata]MCE8040804.1 DUF2489 domain-containing protein [Halomonas desiderata]MCE8045379.1 DUF2489 domain-containing protein [Halomonas desiderata]MCE8050779.1 DUF2489 domain-containing protein [Halomonas desiderata]
MTTTTALILLAVGLAIIAGLAAYAYTLWKEVQRREAFREDELRRAHENCLANLEIVASSLLQEQVDITEGAWRCKLLLDILDPSLLERPDFQAFAEVHARTQHLHTHSARKELAPRDRMREDRERLEVEAEWRQPVLAAAQEVLKFRRDWPGRLH